MDLCFAGNPSIVETLDASLGSSTLFIPMNWALEKVLQQRGWPVKLPRDLIPADLGIRLDDFLVEISRNWYRCGGEDITVFQGISLGEVYSFLIWYQSTIPVYRFAAIATALIRREQPRSINWDPTLDPRFRAIVDDLARHPSSSFQLSTLPIVDLVQTPDYWRPWHPWQARFRDRMLIKLHNLVGSLLDAVISRTNGDTKRVLVAYYPTLNSVFHELGVQRGRFTTIFMERPPLRLLWRMLPRGTRLLDVPDVLLTTQDKAMLDTMREKWVEIKASPRFRTCFVWEGINGWPGLEADLDRFFQTQIEIGARLVNGYRRALADHSVQGVLLPFDTPPLQRLVVEIAREQDIPTLAVLHGLYGNYTFRDWEYCQTDYFAVWGNGVLQHYADFGNDPSRVIITGGPLFDAYYRPDRLSNKGSGSSSTPRVVVVLTNPPNTASVLGDESETQRYILDVTEILRGYSTVYIVVRPHPAELPAFYADLLGHIPSDRLTVTGRGPVGPLLEQADLVIGSCSTALLEAMSLGKPVISVNYSKWPYPPPFDGCWGIEMITNCETLKARLDDIFLNRRPPDTSAYPAILKAFAGPLDGCSGARVVEVLGKIIATGDSSRGET